jgi:hypothetical protein
MRWKCGNPPSGPPGWSSAQKTPLTLIPRYRNAVAFAGSGLSNCRNTATRSFTQRYCRGALCPPVNGLSPNCPASEAMSLADSGVPAGSGAVGANVPGFSSGPPHAASSSTAPAAIAAQRLEQYL